MIMMIRGGGVNDSVLLDTLRAIRPSLTVEQHTIVHTLRRHMKATFCVEEEQVMNMNEGCGDDMLPDRKLGRTALSVSGNISSSQPGAGTNMNRDSAEQGELT